MTILFLSFIYLNPLNAKEYSGGFANIDQGDDLLRPAIFGLVRFDNDVYFHTYLFGREIGNVREQTIVATGGKFFNILSNGAIQGSWGVSLMQEDIKLIGESQTHSERFHYNMGFRIGMRALISKKPITYLAWESHLYPAGSATLFLVTGRQQLLSFGVGWTI